MISNKLDENIYYYTDLYKNSDLFLKRIKSELKWNEWRSSGGSSVYGEISGNTYPLPNWVLEVIKSSVYLAINDYRDKTGIGFGWIPEYYTINKYNTGAYMGPHVDTIDITETKSPTISAVLYLNDDYIGGEIEFPEQNISLKPKAASIVVFPSYAPYYHDPKPVDSGDKYMSPVFCFKEQF